MDQNGPKWRKQKTKKIDRLEISEFKAGFQKKNSI